MISLRKALFVLFVFIYLGVAPFTVLYALGYIFSPVQQTLLQTGLISLSTAPAQARVWINGSPVKDRTPLVLRNLRPGDYEIRIQLKGHRPWQRWVKVAAERAVRFEKILLFPDQRQAEILGSSPLTKIKHVPRGRNLIVLEGGDQAAGLYALNLAEKELQPLLPQPVYKDARVEGIFLHPAGDRAFVTLRRDSVLIPLWVRFETRPRESVQVVELSDLFTEPYGRPEWGSGSRDSIFYLQKDTLKRIDPDRGISFPSIVKAVRGFSLYGRRLFVLDTRNRFLELTEKGKLQTVLLEDPVKSQLVFGKDRQDRYSIFFFPRESLFFLPESTLVIFLSQDGRLTCNRLPYFLDEGVSEVSLAASKPRLAYRKGNDLWVIDFEQEREKAFFESGPKRRKIYEGQERLSILSWFHDDQYLLFLEGNRLRAQDFEGEENTVELLEVSANVRDVALDEARGLVYFADPQTRRLSRARIFEEEGFLPRLTDSL